MKCQTCDTEMFVSRRGAYCPNGHGRLIPHNDDRLRGVSITVVTFGDEEEDQEAVEDGKCPTCDGTGEVECHCCEGMGIEECPHCEQDMDCEECDGEGEIVCPLCKGKKGPP